MTLKGSCNRLPRQLVKQAICKHTLCTFLAVVVFFVLGLTATPLDLGAAFFLGAAFLAGAAEPSAVVASAVLAALGLAATFFLGAAFLVAGLALVAVAFFLGACTALKTNQASHLQARDSHSKKEEVRKVKGRLVKAERPA